MDHRTDQLDDAATLADLAACGNWSITAGFADGQPFVARVKTGAARAADRADHQIHIGVEIPLRQPDGRGLVREPERERLAEIEDLVVRAAAGRAVLVAVLTTRSVRELVLYASSADWIAHFHRELMRVVDRHDLRATACIDPDWSAYHRYR